jgi:4-hydroxy-tetrahydrodipicolinate synthase
MGIEPRTAQEMIDYLEMSAEVGVDAAQVYSLDPGHGHRPTAPEIEKYLEEVLSSTDLPCVVSSHMSVGYRLDPSLLDRLSQKYRHLIGVNCSHPDLAPLIALRSSLDSRIELHVGGPAQALSALALGATGFLSSEGNLAPQTCAALIAGANANDYETATNAFAAISQLSTLLYRMGGIRATKGVLRSLGLPGGYVRRPQLDADEKSVASVLAFLDSLNFKAIETW